MNRLILYIYDKFKKYPLIAWIFFIVLTAGLLLSVLSLSYKEDISDFLPLDEKNQTALSVYQDISGTNNIFAIVSTKDTTDVDPQELADGIESFVSIVEESDSLHYVKNIMKEVDMEKMMGIVDSVYDNIPYFLTNNDIERIDSLLSTKDYIDSQIAEDKQLLLFPSSAVLSSNISRDPLNLFAPVLDRLRQAGVGMSFETYDGYILSPDSKKAIAILESSFGAQESENNAKLVALLENAARATELDNSNLDIHIIGGPVIAVSNAERIKKDSILAITIAGILIFTLLLYVFRNIRNILLIVVSVGWGWLFAMGAIALFYDSVSIIVIGIASVILGIAINYPLHLIDHLKNCVNPRSALREIISPLVVGNVTTVGAFLCLVPLNAPALHDLGLFSSLLLIGTILFVLLFLPHLIKFRKIGGVSMKDPVLISRLSGISLENNKHVVWGVLILTIIFGYFSFNTEFDSDMRNINYMTPEQKDDFAYFQNLMQSGSDKEDFYVVSSGTDWEEALRQNAVISLSVDSLINAGMAERKNQVSDFFVSKEEQMERLSKWNEMINRHKEKLTIKLDEASAKYGFSPEAFSGFSQLISEDFTTKDFNEFKGFISTVFSGTISENKETGKKSVVQALSVPANQVEVIKEALSENKEFGGLFFDVKSMNSSIANTLSDDFNYIGIACGFIVFVFLWISLGSIELAIVSFVPMAFSWIWILGIMGILGIKFNIVNIILATFIFGQGDDYTIFITEGLSYEFAYRKKLLTSYKNSIIVSALIMFIGIGTLLFAKHPAMRSLGEVTVVGMLSVVLMAYIFPPLIFNWLIKDNRGKLRYRPITLKKILCTAFCAAVFFIQLLSAYIIGFFLFVLTKPTPAKRVFFHRYNCSVFRFDIKRMPGIRFLYKNDAKEQFLSPAVIVCNHQSLLDSFCMMFLTPKVVLIANDHIRTNPIVGKLFKWCSFISINDGTENIISKLRPLISEGFSVAIFPEGKRPDISESCVSRFHKGAFLIAEELHLDIIPVYFYGISQIMPKGSSLSNGGPMFIEVGNRISRNELQKMGDVSSQAKIFRAKFNERLKQIRKEVLTVKDVCEVVFERYLYKGHDIEIAAKKVLKKIVSQSEALKSIEHCGTLMIDDTCSQGELALVLALLMSESTIYCCVPDKDTENILIGCMEDFVNNIRIVPKYDASIINPDGTCIVTKSNSDVDKTEDSNIIRIIV